MKLHMGIIVLPLLTVVTLAAPRPEFGIAGFHPHLQQVFPDLSKHGFLEDDATYTTSDDETYDYNYSNNYDPSYDPNYDPNYKPSNDNAQDTREGDINILIDVKDMYPSSMDSNATSVKIAMQDLEQRIADNIIQMQSDILLLKRLFGQDYFARRPMWFSPSDDSDVSTHEGASSEEDKDRDPISNYFPLFPHHDEDNITVSLIFPILSLLDNATDENLFSGFPFIGLDRPIISGLPDVPGIGFADPNELPDNYSNKTHNVHSVNGTEVVVNNTINKESEDNFSSFFHHQVIQIRPEVKDTVPEVKDTVPEVKDTVPVEGDRVPETDKIPKEDDTVPEQDPNPVPKVSKDEIFPTFPSVENERESGIHKQESIPEVDPKMNALNEINSDTVALHSDTDETRPGEEYSAIGEEFGSNNLLMQQTGRNIGQRSLDKFNPIEFPADDPDTFRRAFPGPKKAAYITNSLTDKHSYSEVEELDSSEDVNIRPPDLSTDTKVNRIHANMQGMIKVDPDAEIFNYGLVMKEAQQ